MKNFTTEKLDWDSKFWDIDIYFIKKNENEYDKEIRLEELPINKNFIVQALVQDNDVEQIEYLEDNGFRFVQNKVNLVKDSGCLYKGNDSIEAFNVIKTEELLKYKYQEEFFNLYGNVSRFSYIGSNEKVNEFYFTWLTKSIKGELDQNCIGYYRNSNLEGFITYSIKKEELVIGLIGVLKKYQGKKVSKLLLEYIDYIAFIKGCNRISVSTQGKNIKALNTYIKNGYLIDNIEHWYYLKGGLK